MKIILSSFGKQQEASTKEALDDFTRRVTRYFPCEWKLHPPSKLTDPTQIKKQEAQVFLQQLQPDDYLVLLDERGKNISSPELAELIQERANESRRQLIFLIPFLIIFPYLFNDGAMGIWYSMPVSDFLASAVAYWVLAQNYRKLKKKALEESENGVKVKEATTD